MTDPTVSIIIPTLNEAENLSLLLPRIAEAMKDRAYEVLIVDDNSRDQTPAVCATLSQTYPLRLIVRQTPANGLSGAVLHGMGEARGQFLVVMDADLQHPPERLGDLIAPVEQGASDFAIGSRYCLGGTMENRWGFFRRINSKVATFLARPFAGNTTDPMSGFFCLSRATYQRALRLTPLGYKVGLELMCKCRVQNVHEIPIHFATRAKGESKLTLKQQFKYLEHLSRLYDFCFPRASPMLKFLIATACAWFVAFATYVILLGAGVKFWRASAGAYPAAVVVTAIFHLRYTRTQREFIIGQRAWIDFWIIAAAEWITCLLMAMWLVARLKDATATELFILPFGAATLMRYMLRKEFLQDVRGLRRDIRAEDLR